MITTEILHAYAPYELMVSVRTRHDKEERIGRVCEITDRSNHGDWIKVWFDDVYTFINTNTFETGSSNCHYFFIRQDIIKPILRPLSELKGKHHHLGLLDTDYAKLANYLYDANFSLPLLDVISYNATRELLKHHYNVFNLPEGEYVKKV